MPGYDPYLELLGIPPDRRPPSHRELLGVGPDENDVEKIEAAARKRHEHLGNYTISPQEEVATCAKRLLHEVGSALAALRKLLAAARPQEEGESPPGGGVPPPLPPAVPLPPPVATVANGIPPPLEQGGLVGDAAAAVAAGASPVPVGEPVFVEVVAPEGGELPNLGEIPIPLPWKRGLAWAGRLLRQTGELLRRMAAGVRSIPRRLFGIVRRADGLLRSIAGEGNAILHRFLRMVAIALLVPAVVFAGLFLFAGLANLRTTGRSPSEVASSPENGTVRIELRDPTAKVQVKVDGSVVDAAALKEPLRLAAGEHRLEVASEQFDDHASSFTVRAGAQEVLPVALKPKLPPPAASGTVRIELSDPTAKVQVKIDGSVMDAAKLSEPVTLRIGDHRLEVTSGRFEDYASSFTIRAGAEQVLHIPLTRKLPPAAPLAVAPFDAAQARRHQETWSQHLRVPVETTNLIGMKLVLIPAGEFMMGSPESDPDARPEEKPQHPVRITRPFYLGIHEVTVGQFGKFVEDSHLNVDPVWQRTLRSQADDRPVVMVDWHHANRFCIWLSGKEGKTYRLATEAEWEYACRAGTQTRYSFGIDETDLGDYAWFDGNSDGRTHPVGQKKPNAWGLYDMYGNVWEWCEDRYDKTYYASSRVEDPLWFGQRNVRVLRGGCWQFFACDVRSAARGRFSPDFNYYWGFANCELTL